MEQLLSNAHIDDARLKSILSRIQGEQLLRLSEYGYRPNLREFDLDLLHASGLTRQDIDAFAERTWKGRREEKFKTVSDPFRLFLIWLMWYCLTQNDVPSFKSVLIYHLIRQYWKLFKNIYFKNFCDPNVSTLALDRLSKSHLFSREESIPNAISYLSNELAREYQEGIKNRNLDEIAKFITDSRSRLNQSLKSFARSYYKINSILGQQGIASDEERDDHVSPFSLNTPDQLAYEVSNLICVKGYKDQQAIDEAKKITKISHSMATALVDELSNGTTSVRYFDHVHYILTLLTTLFLTPPFSDITDIVTGLMSVKSTKKPIYFKKEIEDLTSALVENSGRKEKFASLTDQTQFFISKFVAYYVARVLKKTLLQLKQDSTHAKSQIL